MIRVMIVDDQALVRAGFAMLVRSQPDLAVVAECVDGVQCLETLDRLTLMTLTAAFPFLTVGLALGFVL